MQLYLRFLSSFVLTLPRPLWRWSGEEAVGALREEEMADQSAKGEDFAQKAEKKLSGWGLFGSKYDDATDLFEKAANCFKLAKNCIFLASSCFFPL